MHSSIYQYSGFHTEGWGTWNFLPLSQNSPPPSILENEYDIIVASMCCLESLSHDCVRRVGGWDMPPDLPSSHARLRTLLSSCYHPSPPFQLKILCETLILCTEGQQATWCVYSQKLEP